MIYRHEEQGVYYAGINCCCHSEHRLWISPFIKGGRHMCIYNNIDLGEEYLFYKGVDLTKGKEVKTLIARDDSWAWSDGKDSYVEEYPDDL